jgi:hypothetical protein
MKYTNHNTGVHENIKSSSTTSYYSRRRLLKLQVSHSMDSKSSTLKASAVRSSLSSRCHSAICTTGLLQGSTIAHADVRA